MVAAYKLSKLCISGSLEMPAGGQYWNFYPFHDKSIKGPKQSISRFEIGTRHMHYFLTRFRSIWNHGAGNLYSGRWWRYKIVEFQRRFGNGTIDTSV